MSSSGFSNAPISRNLLVFTVSASMLATLTDTKYLLPIHISEHFGRLNQYWRLFTWQTAFTNSTEALFAALTIYQLRIIERLWGTRKFATFLLAAAFYTSVIPPLILALLAPILPANLAYLPSGCTGLVFAVLAQYHATVPYSYRYRLSGSSNGDDADGGESSGILFTSKATSYLMPAQLALSNVPGSLVSAAVGWCVGYAWRAELLLGAGKWRLPGWLLGQKSRTSTRASQ